MSARATAFETLLRGLRRPLNFLDPRRDLPLLLSDLAESLPVPQDIYLADEEATPLVGFPILRSDGIDALTDALDEYVKAEERAHVQMRRNERFDASGLEERWKRYRDLLSTAMENTVTSSYGRDLPGMFWLHHSVQLARLLKDTPQRAARIDAQIGRSAGGKIKYEVLFRYLDRVLEVTHDIVDRIAIDTEEPSDALFPELLGRMRDNVLILTEDYIGPDLAELRHYLDDHLGIDGRDFSYRLARVARWTGDELRRDPELRAATEHLLEKTGAGARELFARPGFLAYVSERQGYEPGEFLSPRQIEIWERLAVKLKEFELMHTVRRLMVPLESTDEHLEFRQRGLDRTWGGPSRTRVSSATRAYDFMAPWVVDPEVARFGMIYDVTDFSQTLSRLERSKALEQDRSMQLMFRFQRRVNRLADGNRLTLEKYLGDGAFYSARKAVRMLRAAILTQRAYRHAVDEGFPFDRGLRMALNFGHYFLLPIETGSTDGSQRYEFFGQGVVELSRLTTGKTLQEIEELKFSLVKLGYSETDVHRFFAPLAAARLDLVDEREESRDFYAYVGRNSKLVNEGIVATEAFVNRLSREVRGRELHRVAHDRHLFVSLEIQHGDERLRLGLRKLGVAELKGLDPITVYEMVDGRDWSDSTLQSLPGTDLVSALERHYGLQLTGASRPRT